MSTTAVDLRRFAEQLCQNPRGEAARRAALSRLYYASYHACRRWHASLPAFGKRTNDRGGVHEELLDQLGHPADSISEDLFVASVALYKALLALRNYRVKSDYELGDSIDSESVIDAKGKVAEIFHTIESVPPKDKPTVH